MVFEEEWLIFNSLNIVAAAGYINTDLLCDSSIMFKDRTIFLGLYLQELIYDLIMKFWM